MRKPFIRKGVIVGEVFEPGKHDKARIAEMLGPDQAKDVDKILGDPEAYKMGGYLAIEMTLQMRKMARVAPYRDATREKALELQAELGMYGRTIPKAYEAIIAEMLQ